jgi:hypothetical protein
MSARWLAVHLSSFVSVLVRLWSSPISAQQGCVLPFGRLGIVNTLVSSMQSWLIEVFSLSFPFPFTLALFNAADTAKALELFLEDILVESAEITKASGGKKLMPYHL